MSEYKLLPIEFPEENKPVKAIIKRIGSWDIAIVELVHVDESDNDYRFVNDGCSLAYEWNVVYWEYMAELQSSTN